MELTKKTTIRKIQFLCLLALLAISALTDNTSNCKRLKSEPQFKKKWVNSLINKVNKVKSIVPPETINGMINSLKNNLLQNIPQINNQEQPDLFKGIAEAIGFSVSVDLEKCLKLKFFQIQEKVNRIIFEYQKFIDDLNNVNGHIAELTKIAELSVEVYNKIAKCNQPIQPQNSSITNRLINAGTKYIGNTLKKHLNGPVDTALADEMARHLLLIKDFKGTTSAVDEETKGKLLGGLIKAVVEKRGGRRRLIKRRRI